MCSIQDDFIENEDKYMQKTEIHSIDLKCNKCGSAQVNILLRQIHAYCKDCFLTSVSHKFKATLGKHRVISPNDRVLVYHTGGYASTALLHLLNAGINNENTPKKLRCTPVVLIIDSDEIAEKKKEALEGLRNESESFGFQTFLISLKRYVQDTSNIDALLTNNVDSLIGDNNIEFDFKGQLNATNCESLVNVYRQRLLVDVAKHLKCQSVFTSEIATDIASLLLTNICLGRGSQIALDTGVCDTRDPQVKIVRPLRLFDIKELVFYNIYNKTRPVIYNKRSSATANVQSLMKSFIGNLQVNYPATVSTIIRTSDKLTSKNSQQTEACSLCKAPKGEQSVELNTAECVNFSRWVSTHSSQNTSEFNKQPTETKYCYSCNKFSDYTNDKVT